MSQEDDEMVDAEHEAYLASFGTSSEDLQDEEDNEQENDLDYD